MPMFLRRFIAALAAVTATVAVVASSPAEAQRSGGAAFDDRDAGRNVAGQFDYYALVLSWSPTYCAGLRRDGYDPQCHRTDGKRYAFILHGLWPQHERGWPESCPTRTRPFVPQRTIDGMLDIMPSPKLIIHEYRKHGTCSGLSPAEYFKVSRRLFEKVRIPPRFQQPAQAFTITPAEIMRDFLSINPDLKPEQMAIVCGGRGSRLTEIRVCFSREGTFRDCGRNEDARRLCRASNLYVPPVRGEHSEGSRGPSRRDERGI